MKLDGGSLPASRPQGLTGAALEQVVMSMAQRYPDNVKVT